MDLLERYLAAVRRNLPVKQADDIVAELREELLERADAEEARGGSVDWDALLQRNGHPLVVAARYRTHQYLIGPELYPFYLYSLRLFGGLAAIGMVISALVKAAIHPGNPGQMIVQFMGSLWWAAAVVVGTTTIIFALVERYGGMDKYFQTWKPGELPEIDLGKEPGRWESIVEIALGVFILLWWVGVVPWPFPTTTSSAFRVEPAPIWMALYWPILALMVGRLAHNVVQWLRPNWRWLRGGFAIATTVGAVILAVLLYRAGHWIDVIPVGTSPDQARGLQDSVELSIRIGIVAAAAVWVWQCAQEVWRWMRGARR